MEKNKVGSQRTLELDAIPHTHPSPSPISWSQILGTLMRPTSFQTRKKKKKKEEKKNKPSGLRGWKSREPRPQGPVLSHQPFAFSCRMRRPSDTYLTGLENNMSTAWYPA